MLACRYASAPARAFRARANVPLDSRRFGVRKLAIEPGHQFPRNLPNFWPNIFPTMVAKGHTLHFSANFLMARSMVSPTVEVAIPSAVPISR